MLVCVGLFCDNRCVANTSQPSRLNLVNPSITEGMGCSIQPFLGPEVGSQLCPHHTMGSYTSSLDPRPEKILSSWRITAREYLGTLSVSLWPHFSPHHTGSPSFHQCLSNGPYLYLWPRSFFSSLKFCPLLPTT